MEDGERLLKALPQARRAAILGAGYIGLRAAEAFRKRGLQVTLLEAKDRPSPTGTRRWAPSSRRSWSGTGWRSGPG